jgi:hypothetical protein
LRAREQVEYQGADTEHDQAGDHLLLHVVVLHLERDVVERAQAQVTALDLAIGRTAVQLDVRAEAPKSRRSQPAAW